MIKAMFHKKGTVQSHIYPVRCLSHYSFGRRTSSSSQKLCFIMNEWCVSARCCFNWHKAGALWCTRHCGGKEKRAPHYCPPPFPSLLTSSERQKLQGELVIHVRGTTEAKRGQRGGLKTSLNQTPLHFSQTGRKIASEETDFIYP